MKTALSLLVLVIAGVLVVYFFSSGNKKASAVSAPLPSQPSSMGTEQPQEGALLVNGWNVSNYGDATIKDNYLRYKDLLGPPISGFDGAGQWFQFGRLTYSPANEAAWKVQLDNLGLQELILEGFTPQPRAEAHPAVRDYLISAMESGLDIQRVVGRIISQPMLDKKTGLYRQFSDKQLFLFDQAPTSGDQVQRAPLGLWLHQPAARNDVSKTSSADPANPLTNSWVMPTLILGGLLALLGLGILAVRSGGSGGSSQTI